MSPAVFLAEVNRFWSKVDKEDECWEWNGERHAHGYGVFCFWYENKRARVLAHRLALTLAAGPFSDDQIVRHRCDNPPCVRPDHLELGTQADNVHDAISRGRADFSGLEVGHAFVRPERPCADCGEMLPEGRAKFCPTCRKRRDAESRDRWAARNRKRSVA